MSYNTGTAMRESSVDATSPASNESAPKDSRLHFWVAPQIDSCLRMCEPGSAPASISENSCVGNLLAQVPAALANSTKN
jgi:hypothetical protein